MAKVTFTGDPRGGENPHACEMFGMAFPLNIAVDVDDEAHLAKLRGNSHFEVEGAAKKRRGRQPKSAPATTDLIQSADEAEAAIAAGEPENGGEDES